MAIPRKDTSFFHAHCHSQFSTIDAVSKVPLIVQKAHGHKQPALIMTDHGSMGAFVQLYRECMSRDMKPYAAFEGYLIDPERDDWETPEKNKPVGRYHFGLIALNEDGYKALVRFMSMTHTRPRFNRFPRCTLNDLLDLGKNHGENLVITTGCYFGLIQQSIAYGDDALAMRYVQLFSKHFPHTFVELQHHNICHDDQPKAEDGERELLDLDDSDIVEKLVSIAEELDLPVIATQDSHYLDHKHRAAHSLMKRMVYASTEDGFPGDSFHLASAAWVADHYPQDIWDMVEDGFDELLGLWDGHISPLDNYVIDVPHVVDDAETEAWEIFAEGLQEYLDENPELDADSYWERGESEFDVITQLKMHDYHMVVADYVRAAQEKEIAVEARGSANGSLVTFGMGITQADPIKWGGMFERYLSLDRTKPPDIDLDVEDAERQWLLSYIINKYDAVQVGTYSKLGTTVDPETGEEKGSVLQSYLMYLRRLASEEAKRSLIRTFEIAHGPLDEYKGKLKPYTQAAIKEKAGVIYGRKFGWIQTMEDVRKHSAVDYKGLKLLADLDSVYKSYGTHAGAVLLPGKNIDWRDYIPTMLIASSDTTVTQFMGDDVEAFGLLKMDILGQAPLRVMKLCQKNIIDAGHVFEGKHPRDFTWIPDDDADACKLLREGRTDTGIFHYEAYTKSRGGKELGIRSTEDAVMGQALFMPGAMETGQKDLYILRRNSARERAKVTYISPEFEKALKGTYGTVIYQEQVIEIMRNLGMDMAGINKFFKVVKDSGKGAVERNRERMAEVRKQFEQLCRKRGIADVDAAWAQTAGFVSYGFNRAHASGYGIRSYRTAYLKAHYPVEYMAALLETWIGRKKEAKYIMEARRIGIKLLPPDVNVSRAVWTQDFERRNVIRKGLASIAGIGIPTATEIEKHAPYTDVDDLVDRTGRAVTGGKDWKADGVLIGTLAALGAVGALDSIMEGEG